MYDFSYNEMRPVDFNPLLTEKSEVKIDLTQTEKEELLDELEKIKSAYARKKKIEELKSKGIDVTDNHKFIADAERQCVNSVIQGR